MHQHSAQKTLSTCSHTLTHKHPKLYKYNKKVEGYILLRFATRRLALLLIMTLIHYERELEPGLCCCPNSNQAVNEAEKNGPNPVMERLFRHVISNTCTTRTPFYILKYKKQQRYREHGLCTCWRLSIYSTCDYFIKLCFINLNYNLT